MDEKPAQHGAAAELLAAWRAAGREAIAAHGAARVAELALTAAAAAEEAATEVEAAADAAVGAVERAKPQQPERRPRPIRPPKLLSWRSRRPKVTRCVPTTRSRSLRMPRPLPVTASMRPRISTSRRTDLQSVPVRSRNLASRSTCTRSSRVQPTNCCDRVPRLEQLDGLLLGPPPLADDAGADAGAVGGTHAFRIAASHAL